MNANDYIFQQVYKTAKEKKASERAAHNAALMAMSNYGKGKFKTVAKLIEEAVKEAVKLS